MIRHIVALRLPPEMEQKEKAALFGALSGLKSQISGILDFQAGPNVSIEQLSRGFDDVFWFDFENTAVRDAYLMHPAHQAIGAQIVAQTVGGLDGVFVFDLELP